MTTSAATPDVTLEFMDDEIFDDPRLTCDDGFPTETSIAQEQVEDLILPFKLKENQHSLQLDHEKHVQFLEKGIHSSLTSSFISLDASRPWICYWITHALHLLGVPLSSEQQERLICTIKSCWNETTGGYGGGPGQEAHLATTYAAVNALCIIGSPEAYESIDRHQLYQFLTSAKNRDGSFRMHLTGEVDVRGSYCAIHVAYLLNLLTPELIDNVPEFIVRCQTFEGGIGGFPGSEAHGGYTFCALACMFILGKVGLLDIENMTDWVSFRQMKFEGGFQGRCNKLVDGCYSFWQGGIVTLLELFWQSRLSEDASDCDFFNREALRNYILLCCQAETGGLRDKPTKRPDFYHTCYCLSGLSLTEHKYSFSKETRLVQAHPHSIPTCVKATHPVHNIGLDLVQSVRSFFVRKDGLAYSH